MRKATIALSHLSRAALPAALLLGLASCFGGNGGAWRLITETPGSEVKVGPETYKIVENAGTFYVAHVGFSSVSADMLRRDARTALERTLGCGGVAVEVVRTDQGSYATSAGCPAP
jgi:hypothetical protein